MAGHKKHRLSFYAQSYHCRDMGLTNMLSYLSLLAWRCSSGMCCITGQHDYISWTNLPTHPTHHRFHGASVNSVNVWWTVSQQLWWHYNRGWGNSSISTGPRRSLSIPVVTAGWADPGIELRRNAKRPSRWLRVRRAVAAIQVTILLLNFY